MQNQQQQGGGEGLQSFGGYGYSHTLTGQADAEAAISDEHQKLGDLGIAEAASPISSRPPAAAIEEMMRVTAKGGGEGASGNRWPRQETLALLQIRSEMDAVFRDASSKGPLWEQVSRKLAELGYIRSAKKCKEKFENVHKYYKRTKEGRAGRQDGKNYKFFTQLEALNHNTSAVTTFTSAVQVHATIPYPTSAPVSLPPPLPRREAPVVPRPDPDVATCSLFGGAVGISFSSDGSSSSERDDEEDDEDVEMESADASRKRKRSRGSVGLDSDERMMDFFEGLMKQVMQKQEAMQQKFLEAIEKREQERMIREEAWKRQDMERLAREHDLMAQERAISSSRDAAIIAFLQKITGQIIDLPNTTSIPQNPHPPPMPVPTAPPSEPQEQHQRRPTAFSQQQQSQSQNQHQRLDQPQNIGIVEANPFSNTSEMVAAIPELTGAGSSLEVTSSRWPKEEVLALIQLRSDLESRYQETGPKGPPWEEISAGMQRLGYNRSAKRCKEKWENINKYFKKVRESNKKRPEDSKTCPYFHELDALYRKKIVGNTRESVIVGGRSGISGSLSEQEKQQEDHEGGMPSAQPLQGNESEDEGVGKAEEQTSTAGAYSSTLFGLQTDHDDTGGAKQPEDVLKRQHQPNHGDMIDLDCPDNFDCSYSDDLDHENDQDNYEEVDHERKEYNDKACEEEIRIAYKMQFQRQNVGSTGGETASTSFTAMVQ